MENSLQTYVNQQFGKNRALMIGDTVWFVGKDVADALGYTAARNAIKKHVKAKHKLTHQIDASGQKRDMTLIDEAGLYSLIMRSNLPAAEDFQEWVTSEVLPAIRKTGMYINPNFQGDSIWLETRGHGKISRKSETAAIKTFIEHARSQGCTWEDKYFYRTLSIWCNEGAGIPKKNGRDSATVHQLNIIDLLEGSVIKNILINGVAENLPYTQIWAKAQQQINNFLTITFQNQQLIK